MPLSENCCVDYILLFRNMCYGIAMCSKQHSTRHVNLSPTKYSIDCKITSEKAAGDGYNKMCFLNAINTNIVT